MKLGDRVEAETREVDLALGGRAIQESRRQTLHNYNVKRFAHITNHHDI